MNSAFGSGLTLAQGGDWDGVVKIAIAFVLGGVLGLERELSQHPAGLRTHILVSIGSAGMMLLGFGLWQDAGMRAGIDPGRVAQGVITGIGFIGAGSIMKEGFSVHGLTTAASIWVACGVGMMVAAGMLTLAVFTTGVALLTLILSGHAMRGLLLRRKDANREATPS
jgi:putative Mg2+ transporter-C (MgtC) family protein